MVKPHTHRSHKTRLENKQKQNKTKTNKIALDILAKKTMLNLIISNSNPVSPSSNKYKSIINHHSCLFKLNLLAPGWQQQVWEETPGRWSSARIQNIGSTHTYMHCVAFHCLALHCVTLCYLPLFSGCVVAFCFLVVVVVVVVVVAVVVVVVVVCCSCSCSCLVNCSCFCSCPCSCVVVLCCCCCCWCCCCCCCSWLWCDVTLGGRMPARVAWNQTTLN